MNSGRPSVTRLPLVALVALVTGVALVTFVHFAQPALAASSTAATPGPGAMTVYTITNPNSTTLNVQQVVADSTGFSYTFTSQIPAGGTVTSHLRDIPQIPSPFQGTLTLYASQPFTAQIVGYDYPSGGSIHVWLPVVTNAP